MREEIYSQALLASIISHGPISRPKSCKSYKLARKTYFHIGGFSCFDTEANSHLIITVNTSFILEIFCKVQVHI